MMALLLMALVAVTGLVIDGGYLYFQRRRIQIAADAGAYSGAMELRRGNAGRIDSAGKYIARRNGYTHGADNVDVKITQLNATDVEAVVTKTVPTTFMRMLNINSAGVAARAVAGIRNNGKTCILGMDETDRQTVNITGTGTILIDCGVVSNSCSRGNGKGTGSFRISGTGNAGAIVRAEYFGACGDFTVSGNPTYYPDLVDEIAPIPDPLAGRAEPVPPATPDFTDLATINSDTVLSPGYYASTGNTAAIRISSGAVTFNPGIYYIQGMKITGGGPIVGEGVTLYNMGASGQTGHTIDITGNATSVRFTAPTTAESASVDNDNIVMWCSSDSADNDNLRHNFAGNSKTVFVGMIYCPAQEVRWGGSHGVDGWGTIFANQVILNGSADMTFSGPPDGISIPELSTVTLIQ